MAQTASLKLQAPAPRMVVRNAELALRVSGIAEAERSVGRIAAQSGGYVEASSGSDLSGPLPTLSVTLRVPEPRFEGTVEALEALGVRLGKTISSDDVTAQAVDLDARLKSLRVQEDAYRAILGAARKISDVLEVQEKLTEVRTGIEQIVAQRRTLGDQAAMSKITVDLSQAAKPIATSTDPDWASQTWGEAVATLRGIGRGLATLGLWGLAMIPVWLPVGVLLGLAVRRGRAAKVKSELAGSRGQAG